MNKIRCEEILQTILAIVACTAILVSLVGGFHHALMAVGVLK